MLKEAAREIRSPVVPAVVDAVPGSFEELRQEVAVLAIQSLWRAYKRRKANKQEQADRRAAAAAAAPQQKILQELRSQQVVPHLNVAGLPASSQSSFTASAKGVARAVCCCLI